MAAVQPGLRSSAAARPMIHQRSGDTAKPTAQRRLRQQRRALRVAGTLLRACHRSQDRVVIGSLLDDATCRAVRLRLGESASAVKDLQALQDELEALRCTHLAERAAQASCIKRRSHPPHEPPTGEFPRNELLARSPAVLAPSETPEPHARRRSRTSPRARKQQACATVRLAAPAARHAPRPVSSASVPDKCKHSPWKGGGSSQWPEFQSGTYDDLNHLPRQPSATGQAGMKEAGPSSKSVSPSPRKASYKRMLKLAAPTTHDRPPPSVEDSGPSKHRSQVDVAAHQRRLDELAIPTRPECEPGVWRKAKTQCLAPSQPAAPTSNTAMTGRAYICTWQHVPGSQLTSEYPYAYNDGKSSRVRVGDSYHSYAAPPPPPPGCGRLPEPLLPTFPAVTAFLGESPEPSLLSIPAAALPVKPQLRQPPLAPPEPDILPPQAAPSPPNLRQPEKLTGDAELTCLSAVATIDVSDLTPLQAYALSVRQIVSARELSVFEIDQLIEDNLGQHKGEEAQAHKTEREQEALDPAVWRSNSALREGIEGLLKSLEARHMQALALAAAHGDKKQNGWTEQESASWQSWIDKLVAYKVWMKTKALSQQKHDQWICLLATLAKATSDVCRAVELAEQSIVTQVLQVQLLEPDIVAHMNLSARSCPSLSLLEHGEQILNHIWQCMDQLEKDHMAALDRANTALSAYDPAHRVKPLKKSAVLSLSAGTIDIPGDSWSEEETAKVYQWAANLLDQQLHVTAKKHLSEDLEAYTELRAQIHTALTEHQVKMTDSFWIQHTEIWSLASQWERAYFEDLDKSFSPLAGLRACQNRDLEALCSAWEQHQARWMPFYREVERYEATERRFEFPADTQSSQELVNHFEDIYQSELRQSTESLQELQGAYCGHAGHRDYS